VSKICIKIGGNALKDDRRLEAFLSVFSNVMQPGDQWLMVHGGGPVIAGVLDQYKVPHEFIGGHRKTDAEAIRLVEMALSGAMNGRLVRGLLQHGIKAVGLTGMDGAMARSEKRWHHDEQGTRHDLGQVGDIRRVDTSLLLTLLEKGFLPVVAPLALAPDFTAHNVNADMFAAHVAAALPVDELILLTDVEGFYRDINDPASLMEHIRLDRDKKAIWHTLQGGMIPKLEAAEIALKNGVRQVRILNGARPASLTEWRDGRAGGTLITGE